jgi:hypothetical protein
VTKEQKRARRVDQFFLDHGDALVCQGAVVTTSRSKDGHKYGPYYRLECRLDGRKVSVFLGSDGPLVAAARHMLAELQRPLRQRRALTAFKRQLRRGLRAERKGLADELTKIGLYFHGSEIRGYRAANRTQRLVPAAPEKISSGFQNPEN